MRHFFSTRIKVILALALVLALLLGLAAALTGSDASGDFFRSLLTPLRSGASALTGQVQRLYNYFYNYDALKAENEQLRDQLSAYREEERNAAALERENARLRQLLELLDAHPDYSFVDADVITRSSGDWTSTITVNRGASAGLSVGMCAVTANGAVVGLITEVGNNYAVIRTVLDSKLNISATVSASGCSGIVSGSYLSGQADMLRMDYLSSTAILRKNDQVVTSGSTAYPKNLILGYIADASFDDVGVTKYAILQPAADIANLEQVFIITEYDCT